LTILPSAKRIHHQNLQPAGSDFLVLQNLQRLRYHTEKNS